MSCRGCTFSSAAGREIVVSSTYIVQRKLKGASLTYLAGAGLDLDVTGNVWTRRHLNLREILVLEVIR
jgi:hypothetical protein